MPVESAATDPTRESASALPPGVEDTPEQRAAKQAAVDAMPTLPEPVDEPPNEAPFVVTKEHRRFAEFADAVEHLPCVSVRLSVVSGSSLSSRRQQCPTGRIDAA